MATTHTLLETDEGLKVSLEAHRDLGPCVTLNGPDGEIQLIGYADIDDVIRALELAKSRTAVLSARVASASVALMAGAA